MSVRPIYILGIESSCDDTAAAVSLDRRILSNVTAGQEIHSLYGGVVPELASRAHQQNIVPVVDAALKKAGIQKQDLHAVAFTRGPGLMGSLLVGGSFAKSFALGLGLPLLEVNHLRAHILAHFIESDQSPCPSFPLLCLTVSGGHTQLVLMQNDSEMNVIGETCDDAAGEAFDKAAKILGLPYPGGPLIDQLAKKGNPLAFSFPHPHMDGLSFSFSGLKTAFMYFIEKQSRLNPNFVEEHKADLCASIQETIIQILLKKLVLASEETGIRNIAISGGVSANSGLRNTLQAQALKRNWTLSIPRTEYCTDNAAMIAVAGYFKYLRKEFSGQGIAPAARYSI
ncbi:MAG: tRNA (adenosine(37)-N6)-threonylcarbamoyltransferase complex transferase subunit TsaD [Bacteroidia bacterium]